MFRKHQSKAKKMFIGAVLSASIIGGMVFGTQLDFGGATTSVGSLTDQDQEVMDVLAEEKETEAEAAPVYELLIDGQVVGTLTDRSTIPEMIEAAKEQVVETIGYETTFEFLTSVNELEGDQVSISEPEALMAGLEVALTEVLDEILIKACVLKIDDFTVTLESMSDAEEVLELAQSLYVQDDSAISVTMSEEDHNDGIMTPEIKVLSKALPDDRVFMTSAMLGEPMEDMDASEDEFLEAVVVEVTVEQDIMATEAFVSAEEILDIAAAVEMITKEHAKIKTYVVVSGDVPSIIAEKNLMTTKELYDLNPGLRENARRIQIGDELTVMKPEAEMDVVTVEDVIYTEIINRDIVYVNDPDNYIGTYEVLEAGSDGVIEVRATVTKRNGVILEHEIISETKVLDPVRETQSRGVKALPVTTATGTFEVPMLTYTFTSDFGYRWGRQHKGIDLAAPTGTAIKASDGGRVIKAGWDGGYGYCIEIDHGKGMTTKYAHLSKMYVSVGEEVSQYETIGACGNTGNSTGPHLHFEIRKWGTPVDPEIYINP